VLLQFTDATTTGELLTASAACVRVTTKSAKR
jgi:hypothetical protein